MQDNGLLNGLNDAQREAVTHGEGPALVLAGPGSGKTTVIVRRILYLIRERHVPPERILVVTFTKDAALSMQKRFAEQARGIDPVAFGTFHSIFFHILLESGHCGARPAILSSTQKISIMSDVLRKLIPEISNHCDPAVFRDDVVSLLAAVGYYKNTQDREAACGRLPDRWQMHFDRIFAGYQSLCRARRGLDFDDMVYECRELLVRDRRKLEYWQGRFSHILIDEFQDINPLQYEVVKLLGACHRNLFAVGDDDQSIYGFRGSDPGCLKRFLTEFQARRILLNANYRSAEEIVSQAEKVISVNRNRFPKQCYAAGGQKSSGRFAVVRDFAGKSEEYEYLVRELKDFLRRNRQDSCGVLFRTNGGMQFLASLLEGEGIPFRMKERTENPYQHFIAKDVMAYLKLAAGEKSRETFLRIMNRPSRYLERECVGNAREIDFEELIRWHRVRGRPGDLQAEARLRRLEEQLRVIGRMSPGLAVSYICRAVGYERYLKERKEADEHLEEWQDMTEFLIADARKYDTVREWERGQSAGAPGPRRDGRIHLMTVHASKGLEFDAVWMPDCNEKNYPHGNLADAAAVEEERRIFYVGMTRAKKHLELLCTTGTAERPRMMSRFLNPIVGPGSG